MENRDAETRIIELWFQGVQGMSSDNPVHLGERALFYPDKHLAVIKRWNIDDTITEEKIALPEGLSERAMVIGYLYHRMQYPVPAGVLQAMLRETESWSIGYCVDIVHCIDVCENMQSELQWVKKGIVAFNKAVENNACIEEQNRRITSLRVRLIAFSDVCVDQKRTIQLTDFFELPKDEKGFLATLNSVSCGIGGGDNFNNGLEALAYAIRSKWRREEDKKWRHMIVVWSNGKPRPLGESQAFFPPQMAKSFEELTEWWMSLPEQRRLLILAPKQEGWNEIAASWPETIMYPSEAGRGMTDHDLNSIIEALYDL